MAKAKKKATSKPKAKAKPKVKAKPKAKPKVKAKPKAKAPAPKKAAAKKPAKVKPVAAPKAAVRKPVQEKPVAVRAVTKVVGTKALEPKKPVIPVAKKEAPVEPPKPPPPPPVSPVSRKEQIEIRERLAILLEQLQNNIQGGVKAAGERDLAHIVDTSDMASDSAEGDLAFRIAESEGANATEVQKAIEKIDTGTYGLCERCMKSIGMERIHALPFATHCIKCQELAEIRRKDDDEAELDDLADAIDDGQDEA